MRGWGYMWADNETERDFLNFSGVAETVAEIIVQAKGRPISIGVSGAWGIGKSSMIKLTRSAVAAREDKSGKRASTNTSLSNSTRGSTKGTTMRAPP